MNDVSETAEVSPEATGTPPARQGRNGAGSILGRAATFLLKQREASVLVIALVLFIYFAVTTTNFVSHGSFVNIAQYMAPYVIIGIGVKLYDLKRKREAESVHLQAQISDALLRDQHAGLERHAIGLRLPVRIELRDDADGRIRAHAVQGGQRGGAVRDPHSWRRHLLYRPAAGQPGQHRAIGGGGDDGGDAR